MNRHAQRGVTLVVSLIMLIVLTLLVVSAIRFGSINLKIANNVQAEVEGTAATQVAIERQIEDMNAAAKVDTVPAVPAMQVSTGGKTYSVDAAKPKCVLSSNVSTIDLDPKVEADRACIGNAGGDPIFDQNGNPMPQPTECRNQQWDVAATLADQSSGEQVTIVQGVSLRVPSQVLCQ